MGVQGVLLAEQGDEIVDSVKSREDIRWEVAGSDGSVEEYVGDAKQAGQGLRGELMGQAVNRCTDGIVVRKGDLKQLLVLFQRLELSKWCAAAGDEVALAVGDSGQDVVPRAPQVVQVNELWLGHGVSEAGAEEESLSLIS